MSLKRFLRWGSSSLLLVLLLATTGAQAATLNLVGIILHGASGVVVGENLYDVEFVDGICSVVFSGCDSTSDFTFNTLPDAYTASQALLNQVFLDGGTGAFDASPRLIYGCGHKDVCVALTPFEFIDGSAAVQAFGARNVRPTVSPGDNIIGFSTSSGYDAAQSNSMVWAVWTPVPEPGTGLLMGLGLLVMGIRTRRSA